MRLRHWKQRFEPGARFVWRRSINWKGDEMTVVGDRVPDDIGHGKLRRLWDARKIELRRDDAAAEALSHTRHGSFYHVTTPDGVRKVQGKAARDAVYAEYGQSPEDDDQEQP